VFALFALRFRSFNAFEQELRRPRVWEAWVGRRKPSADTMGRVRADDALSWSSDVAGPLGTGSSLVLPPPACGSQTITLSAADSSGAVGSASVRITRCCFSVLPEGISYGQQGGTGTLAVHVAGECAWQATSDASWIVVSGGASASGDGTVSYTVLPFWDTGLRRGSITVGDRRLVVTQAGYGLRVRRHLP
jgi:hypothetical protein